MRLILDTVTFMWAVSSPQRLSRAAMTALRKETTMREISVVSLTEIAVKQTRGKLTFSNADAMAGPRSCPGSPWLRVTTTGRTMP